MSRPPARASLLLFVSMLAVTPARGVGREADAAPARLELDGEVVVPLDLSTGRPVVEARFNGGGPIPLVFDTGGVGLMIDADLADELELEVVGVSSMSSPLGDPGGIEVQQARVDRVGLGGATLVGLLADLWSGAPLFHGPNRPRGVFGITLLRDSLVTVDLPKSRITLERGSLPEGGPDVIELGSDQGLPVVSLDVAGITIAAHLDTGNPSGLTLPLDLSDRLPLSQPPVLVGQARTVDATVGVYAATLSGPVTIGNRTFEELEVHFLEGSSWGNVGMALLRRFTLAFDLRNQRARLEYVKDRPRERPEAPGGTASGPE